MMGSKLVLAAVILLAFGGSYLGKIAIDSERDRYVGRSGRIVSLAPSITETLFALGLDDKVVGVTRFCDYPPAAQTKVRVGGYFDPNYEAIVALDPEFVVVLEEHLGERPYLERLGFTVLVVDHKTISGILDSVSSIGALCGAEQVAAELVGKLRGEMAALREQIGNAHRPSVMISVGRSTGRGSIQDVIVASEGSFFGEMVELAGGTNSYTDHTLYPAISKEGIMRLDPEIIIDLIPEFDGEQATAELLDEWNAIAGVRAVQNKRVHIFSQKYASIPGPRFIQTLKDLASVIHPGAIKENPH